MWDSLKKLGLALFTLLTPIKTTLLAAFVFVLIDLITGLLAAKKQHIPITSSGLKSTLIKLFVYQIVIILAYLAETYLVKGMSLTNIVTSYVGITELLSINENLTVITGSDLLSGLISKIKTLQS